MNEWDKLQAENEARRKDSVKVRRRVAGAEAEVRIWHEGKQVLIGLAIIALLVLVAGVAWTLTHR